MASFISAELLHAFGEMNVGGDGVCVLAYCSDGVHAGYFHGDIEQAYQVGRLSTQVHDIAFVMKERMAFETKTLHSQREIPCRANGDVLSCMLLRFKKTKRARTD